MPLIERNTPNHILEIGHKTGINTTNISEYCKNNNVKLTVIDPHPNFDVSDMEKYNNFKFYNSSNLDILSILNDVDIIVIDGSYKGNTALNELKKIEETKNKKFPLIFLHDTTLPYKFDSVYPFHNKSHENYYNQNEVCIAIEQFINESELNFSYYNIPSFPRLCILFEKNEKIKKNVEEIIDYSEIFENLEKDYINPLLSNLSEEKNKLNNLLNEKEKIIHENNSYLEKIKKENKKLNSNMENLKNENNDLTKMNKKRKMKLTELSDLSKKLEKTNKKLEQIIETKNNELKELKELNNQQNQQLNISKKKIINLKETNKRKEKLLKKEQSKNEVALDRIVLLTKTKLELSKKQDNEINKIKDNLENQLSNKNKQIKELEDLNKKNEEQIEIINVKYSDIIVTNKHYEEQIFTTKKTIEKQKETIEKQSSEINKLKSSNSWKITGPLRKISNFFKSNK